MKDPIDYRTKCTTTKLREDNMGKNVYGFGLTKDISHIMLTEWSVKEKNDTLDIIKI